MKKVGIFLYPIEIYYIRPYGTFYGNRVIWWQFGIFPPFWYIVSRKIWQPCCGRIVELPSLRVVLRASWLAGSILVSFLGGLNLCLKTCLPFQISRRLSEKRQDLNRMFRNGLIYIEKPGVDVTITIFCDFCKFSAGKNGVFLKNQ
jgi:hypothetical protein